jgi:hypothetical protein
MRGAGEDTEPAARVDDTAPGVGEAQAGQLRERGEKVVRQPRERGRVLVAGMGNPAAAVYTAS